MSAPFMQGQLMKFDEDFVASGTDYSASTVSTWITVQNNEATDLLVLSYTPPRDGHVLIHSGVDLRHNAADANISLRIYNGDAAAMVGKTRSLSLPHADKTNTHEMFRYQDVTANTSYSFALQYYQVTAGTITIDVSQAFLYLFAFANP